jgi:phage protein U
MSRMKSVSMETGARPAVLLTEQGVTIHGQLFGMDGGSARLAVMRPVKSGTRAALVVLGTGLYPGQWSCLEASGRVGKITRSAKERVIEFALNEVKGDGLSRWHGFR